MKIYICCSKHFYNKIPEIKEKLEKSGHTITLPNSYDEPMQEERLKQENKDKHVAWKANMIRAQEGKVRANDSILVLNYEKNCQANYIGGATFLEIFKAFELNKKIYFLNPIPEGILKDELTAFNPTIIN